MRAAVVMVSAALTEVRARLAPGWVRSRISRRSLGRVKSLDWAHGGFLGVVAGVLVGNKEGTAEVSGCGFIFGLLAVETEVEVVGGWWVRYRDAFVVVLLLLLLLLLPGTALSRRCVQRWQASRKRFWRPEGVVIAKGHQLYILFWVVYSYILAS